MISESLENMGIQKLQIFDNFRIDRTLPKYSIKKDLKTKNQLLIDQEESEGGNASWDVPQIDSNATVYMGENSFTHLRFDRFFSKISNFFSKKKDAKIKKQKLVSILEYFTNLSESFNELSPLGEISEHYEKAIIQATKLGQKSLVEKLKDLLNVVRGEAHLIQMGLIYYVTNEQMCDFYKKIIKDKSLKLTWVENFTNIIPNEIVEVKAEIDNRKVFDNYVILHYDPEGNATSLTKEQIAIKKDPILFGVMKHSTRLYYIGDWKDDYCDLTLESMFEKLGEKVLEINNKTLKTYIDKVGNYEQKREKIIFKKK